VKENFNLSCGDLQSMASYEWMGIPIKNKTQLSAKWSTPGIFCSNTFPKNWKDAQMSLTRRLLVVNFDVPVTTKDPTLRKRIDEGFGSFYRKCNEAYLHLVNEYGSKSLEPLLPERFKNNLTLVRDNNNPLSEFLNVTTGEVKPGRWIKTDIFMTRFNEFCKRTGRKAVEVSNRTLKENLELRGYKLETGTKEWPLNSSQDLYSVYCVGIEFVATE